MPDRSVLVRLTANNAAFDAAMRASADRVKSIGHQARLSGDVTTLAFYRMKAAAISFATGAVLGAGQSLINLQQSAQVAFTSMMGDAQKASALIGSIYQWDQTIPIPFQNALAGAQKLMAYGLQAQQLIPTLQAVADATGAAGDPTKFDQILLAIGQIQSKGRVMSQEMLQLTEAGIPAWQILADEIGVSVPDAMKMAEKGTIDANTALNAFRDGIEKRFPEAAQKLKDTTQGAWQSFLAGVRDGAASVLRPLQDVGKQALQTGHDIAQIGGAGVGSVVQGLTSSISALLSPLSLLSGVAADGQSKLEQYGPTLTAAGLAMLVTHNRATQLASGWDTLRIRGLYVMDAFRGFGTAIMGIPARFSSLSTAATTGRAALAAIGATARTVGSTMLAAFGGPLGLAIIGATTAMSLWGQAQQDAKQREADHEQQLSSLKDTLDRITGSLTAATRAKFAKDWVDDGTVDRMKQFGINADLAMQAVLKGGPAMAAFKDQFLDQAAAAFQASSSWGMFSDSLKASGKTADEFARDQVGFLIDTWNRYGLAGIKAGSDTDVVRASINGLFGVYQQVAGAQRDVTIGADQQRQAFDLVVGSVSDLAGVSKDKLTSAFDDAYASGTSLNDALASLGVYGAQQTAVIQELGNFAQIGADGMYYLSGAAGEAGAAMSAAGDGAEDGADKISDASARAVSAMQDQLQAALALRQQITAALTSFVSPVGSWEAAVETVNPTKSGGGGGGRKKSTKSPAVVAAEAALKAGKIQAEGTKKSAKAEQDAAIKAAAKIRDAIKSRADADLKAARTAEKSAKDRVTAAKKEADDLKRIADDATKQATDAQDRLEAAQFAKRAADIALQAAQAGLASAKTPEERASWERAVATAIADQATATANLTQAQQTATATTQAATDAKNASEAATSAQTQAENDYQAAQDHTAQVSETTSARKTAADNTYTSAKEKADTRYQKSVDAVNSKLDALTTAQDKARESAQNMATGASSAVGGMSKKITPSLQDWITELEKQVTAQQTWHDNILTIAKKLGPDIALQLTLAGPQLATGVAELTKGTPAELAKFAALFPKATDQGVQGMVNSLVAATAPTALKAANLSDAVIASLLDGLKSAKTQAEADTAIAAIMFAMQGVATQNPVKARVDADLKKAETDLLKYTGDKHVKVIADLDASNLRTSLKSAMNTSIGPILRLLGVPGFARGGNVGDGLFITGEEGPEIGLKQGNSVRIFSNPESQRMIPAPAPSGPSITIQQTNHIYYPQGTPPAVATNRELASAAALGGLG